MNNISPQDMERYRSRLSSFNLGASATDNAIRALHLVLVTVIDREIRKAAKNAQMKDSFLSSASHASLASGQEPENVDLAVDERREGASNISDSIKRLAP